MSPLLDRKLRFSDVVYAIDIGPKALRNWLQRDQVKLISERPADGGWRTFTYADVAILAIVRRLVAFGIDVETASHLSHQILVFMQGEKWLNTSLLGFSMFWTNRCVVLRQEGDDWYLQIRDGWQDYPLYADAYITIHPEPLLDRAFNRALAGSEDDDTANGDLAAGIQKLTIAIKDATPDDGENADEGAK